MACEPHKNPLQRGGMSQADRRLPGLSPEYVRIDERRYADWIVFAAEFSKWLRFYDSGSGSSLNGWQAFFARDVSAVLGGFAVQDIETWRQEVRERLDFLRKDDHPGLTDADWQLALRKNLGELFGAAVTLAKALDDFYLRLGEDLPFKATLRKFIKARLAPALRRLLGYLKAAQALGLYQAVTSPDWKILDRPLSDADAILGDPSALTAEWWDPAAGQGSYAAIAADAGVFGEPGSVFARASHAANHFLFSSVFDLFTEAYARLISDAEAALAATLEQDGHKPHYALFLTFLRLYRHSQDKMNGLLWRHLDHYYKDILRLKPKGPEPDHVHILAELAKSASGASLPQGALFKAGKDSRGKDVFYALDKETTFNKAEVAQFKAVYRIDPADTWQDAALKGSKRYFASPMMDSADGLGAPLLTPFGEWHPFLNKTSAADGAIAAVNMPSARIGFALASHYLFLAEGARTIKLRLGGDLFGSFPKEKLRCYLTHEKGWLEKAPQAVQVSAFSGGDPCTEIEIRLAGTDPAIIAWSAKVHGGTFNVDVPVVQCVLKNEAGTVYGLDELKNISITSAEVWVKAGTSTGDYDPSGVKQLYLGNANGALDPSKPFMPWGAIPEKDAPLVIGSKEVFSKRNAAFNLHIEWANRPVTIKPSPGGHLEFLEGGVWESESASLTNGDVCSSPRQKTFTADVAVPAASLVDYRDPYPALNPASRAGFARLVLDQNFGQEAFAAAQLAALVGGATGDFDEFFITSLENSLMGVFEEEVSAVKDASMAPGIGLENKHAKDKPLKGKPKPYLPVINAVYLSYAAGSQAVDLMSTDEKAFAARPVRLFHLGPFGAAEQDFPVSSSGHYLLPQFRHAGGPDHVGEWLIGFKNLAPRQSVEALFQVLEGSTLPTLSKPENHVTWSYWAGNRWEVFEERDVGDSTKQLIQSGIVRFNIPDAASTGKGILPHGHVWVMASVNEAAEAVCKILSVKAQAMRATLALNVMPGPAPDFLDRPLPAGAIGKLKDADARFKKFSQPYPSFGGRQTEGSERFYLRSSERLRHKGRAATIWDYESLVLEAFPSVYKVKCLNHTRIEDNPDAGLAIYNENAPGHVALIAVPNLINRNDANPLKPFAAQDLLTGIRDYLRERVTGQLVPGPVAPYQVNVHVCNPLFEEIQLEFDLKLKEGYEDFSWYRQVLQEEITRHLSPWAFAAEGQGADLQFGGRISKSALINFIEERPYVDFITSVVLKQKSGNAPLSGDLEEAVASTSRSILVSVPSGNHAINPHGT